MVIDAGQGAGLPALIPTDEASVAAVARRCRRVVLRRALISAAASVVPLPGIDIAVDIGMLLRMIDEVNAAFGLTPEQVERLSPHRKAYAYQAITVVGSALVGRVLTRDLLVAAVRRVGLQLTAGQAAKLVPVAGQVLAATISFGALKFLGDRHVEDCVRIARRVLQSDIGEAGS
ncbi:MAG TPA: hypothetical protein VMU33_05730 [Burkholderiaceae bacterium]|nr:hypothetical protein [Burkholderiaceae bacterium]